jgi:hypothetical protein
LTFVIGVLLLRTVTIKSTTIIDEENVDWQLELERLERAKQCELDMEEYKRIVEWEIIKYEKMVNRGGYAIFGLALLLKVYLNRFF